MLVQSKQDVAKFQLVILFEHETVSLMKKNGNVANNVQLNDKEKFQIQYTAEKFDKLNRA